MSPNGVCPLSLGRKKMIVPAIFRGKRTRSIEGNKGILKTGKRPEVRREAIPIAAP
jgi:hypothetical protein